MIPRKRIVIPILLIIASLLLYFLLLPNFRESNSVESPVSVSGSSIRVNPLDIQNEPPVEINNTHSPSVSASLVPGAEFAGRHNLDLDQAQSLYVRMYGDDTFLYEQYAFAPTEKIFLLMEFNQLKAGEYYLSALWKAPNGQLINTSRHTISLAGQSPQYRSFFWLKLIKNGAITELITGDEYKGDIHGKWSVEIHLDGAEVLTQHFMVNN